MQVRLTKPNTKKVRVIAAEMEETVPSVVNAILAHVVFEKNNEGVMRLTLTARKTAAFYKNKSK